MKNIEQGTAEWLEMRRSHIGSSDIAAILGISPWKTSYELWLDKTGRLKEDEPNSAMKRGSFLEEEARLQYCVKTDVAIIPAVKVSKEWSVCIASLDGITMDEDIICEIKCPGPKNFELALMGEIPEHYKAQMQWQLWVTKARKCDYFVYLCKNESCLIEVFPDLDYQKMLIEKAREFWKCVETDTPPSLEEKDYVCIEDEEANRLSSRWKELKLQSLDIEKEMKEIEKSLLDFSDDGNCYFPSSNVWLSRVNRKGNVDWKAVQLKWEISDEEIEKFRKKGIGYVKFSIKGKNEN